MTRKEINPTEALGRLRELCSRSEYCTNDMAQKLYRWGIGADTASKIIESLQRDRFVDDARFARAFVRDKYRFSGWGRIKIRAALGAKRISSGDIDAALDEIDAEEYEATALKALKAKLRTLGDEPLDHEGRTKLLRFGASRGYEVNLLCRLIKSLG